MLSRICIAQLIVAVAAFISCVANAQDYNFDDLEFELSTEPVVRVEPDGTLTFLRPAPVSQQAMRDLLAIGRGEGGSTFSVDGLGANLPDQILGPTERLFNLNDPSVRMSAAQDLIQMANEFSEVSEILAIGIESGMVGGNDIKFDLYETDATLLDQKGFRTQITLNTFWETFGAGKGQRYTPQSELLDAYRVHGDVLLAGTLARSYQYGIGGEENLERAGEFWVKALAAAPNPANQLGAYEYYLTIEDSQSAAAILGQAVAADDPVILGRALEAILADEPVGAERVDIENRSDRLAREGSSLMAVFFGDYLIAGNAENRYERALKYYELAVDGDGSEAVIRGALARGANTRLIIAELQDAELDYGAVRSLLEQLVRSEEAAAYLGLAMLVRNGGDFSYAYELARIAADLAPGWISQHARAVMAELCSIPNALDCAPTFVLFATTRLPLVNGTFVRFDNRPDYRRRVSFGIAFVNMPRPPGDPQLTQLKFERAEAAVEAVFGKDARSRMNGAQGDFAFANQDPATLSDLLDHLGEAFSRDDAFVYVHGFATDFAAATSALAGLSDQIGFGGMPIALTWASSGSKFDYGIDDAIINSSCRRLSPVLNQIGEYFGGAKMSLLAHSLGGELTIPMIGGCSGAKDFFWSHNEPIHNLVFAAPDVSQEDFDELTHINREKADRITLYATSNDLALNIASSRSKKGTPRAGQAGKGLLLIRSHFETVDATDVEYSIVDPVGDMFNHGYVFTRPEVIKDLSQIINEDLGAAIRECLSGLPVDPPEYWAVRRSC